VIARGPVIVKDHADARDHVTVTARKANGMVAAVSTIDFTAGIRPGMRRLPVLRPI